MPGLILGLYGAYLIWVGFSGKFDSLADELGKDAPEYFPWAIGILCVAVLTQFESTQKLVKPFIGLLLLNFFLRNYDNIEAEVKKLSDMAQGVAQ